ncbi:MAG TPA: nucleoside diphosphate kinase regulator [Pseudomonadales bacterium]|jgi:regulator of nucleoside diphosphate kinase
MKAHAPNIIINSHDAERLRSLLDRAAAADDTADRLEAEIDRARLLPPERIPPQTVTMRSVVRFHLSTIEHALEKRLVYPRELQDPATEVSVLSPIGAALLGLSEGDSMDWELPDHRVARITVEAVVYQPEAQGEYSR